MGTSNNKPSESGDVTTAALAVQRRRSCLALKRVQQQAAKHPAPDRKTINRLIERVRQERGAVRD